MNKKRCQASVFHRDQLRYTGRGVNGFEMHFNEEQCKLPASSGPGGDYCRHHASFGDNGRCRWAEPFMPEKKKQLDSKTQTS